jgi:hypothetical protein
VGLVGFGVGFGVGYGVGKDVGNLVGEGTVGTEAAQSEASVPSGHYLGTSHTPSLAYLHESSPG